jgi:asparagine synthase (glutamine-hydrolysing)
MLRKIRTIKAILTQYGLSDTLWRLRYNRRKKAGHFSKHCPAFRWSEKSLSDYFNTEGPQSAGDIREYLKKRDGNFLFSPGQFPQVPLEWRTEAIHRADAIIERGEFTYFFCRNQRGGLGYPEVDWFKNPFTGQRDAQLVHWSLREDFDPKRGDIKYIWEPGRFSWVYDLVRAFAATREDKYPEAFWQLLESWMKANEPMIGPGWQCGQETAIKIMGICFGLQAFLNSPASTEDRLEQALLLLAICADRIESNIEYARRQRSNHSSTEAIGLFIAAIFLPHLKKAETFLRISKHHLLIDTENHFKEDGSYFQHSMNYQRMTMHCFLWYLSLARKNGIEIPQTIFSKMQKAWNFLYQLQDETGRVPNYGSNDGALLCPWSHCDYLDYRPMLSAMYFALEGKRIYPEGAWNEESLWFFGDDFPKASFAENIPSRKSCQFSLGGYYSLRRRNSWAMMRCHTYASRPAQADQLHVDLWWNGINLLRDTGTFSYYDPEKKRNLKYISTAMQNTIEIDGESQMIKGPRFYWASLSKGKCYRANDTVIEGEHDGYARLGVRHKRRLESVDEKNWRINDTLLGKGSHTGILRWHFPYYPAYLEDNRLILESPGGQIIMQISADVPIQMKLQDEEESLYYGQLSPAKVLEVLFTSPMPVNMETFISLPD